MAKVYVTINPKDGTKTLEVEGMSGGACEDVTKAIMQANQVVEHQYTSEMCDTEEMPDYVEDVADAFQETLEE